MSKKFLLSVYLCLLTPLALGLTNENLGLPTNFQVGQKAYSEKLFLGGITFQVFSPNASIKNVVTIIPTGFKRNLASLEIPVSGLINGAEVADLNNDGYPELFIYINTDDKHAYGSLLAYASNKNRSLTPIYLPTLSDVDKNIYSYNGHDEFAVIENRLIRRFPTVGDNKVRHYHQIQYQLVAGEAGWVLKPASTINF